MGQTDTLRELSDVGLSTTLPDESFERFARLVHRHLGAPIAMVSLIVGNEQLIPGAHGLPSALDQRRVIPHTNTFCSHVARTGEPLIVRDTQRDPYLSHHRGLRGFNVAAYAGFPIYAAHGSAVGTLCAIDTAPRLWSADELATLADLAAACSSELRLRLARSQARALQHTALQATRRSRLLLSLSESFAEATTIPDLVRCLVDVGKTIHANWVGLALVDPGGKTLTYTTMDHMEPRLAPKFRKIRLTDDRPSALAARSRIPLFYSNHEELIGQFPAIRDSVDDDAGARAFLPVLRNGNLLGIMMMAWDSSVIFDKSSQKTYIAISRYLAHALERVQLLETQQHIAMTLQNAMLSPLPHVRHLDLGSVYAPAAKTDQVGGDWYDAVALSDDSCVVMIGDVTGHDMQAAALMGQLRSMLRAFTWSHHSSPADLLTMLDHANRSLNLQATATVIIARIDHSRDQLGQLSHRLTWSNAGHPPLAILRNTGEVEILTHPPDMMLGVMPDATRHNHHETLHAGDTIVLYTDGLVERRGVPYSERFTDLGDTLGDVARVATHALPDALVRRMTSGNEADDVAVLAVRVRYAPLDSPYTDQPLNAHLDVDSETTAIGPARRWVDDILESDGCSMDMRRTAMLLTSELVTNAVRHGTPPVTIDVILDHRSVRVEVGDSSPALPQVRFPEPHETGGRGIQFLNHRADRWGVREHLSADGSPRKTVWFDIDKEPG